MHKRYALPVVGIAALALSACAGVQYDRAKATSAGGSAFHQALYAEYIDLSGSEFGEADYKESDVFASRAIAAAGGTDFGPEELSARALPADKTGDLGTARLHLVSALARGGATAAPAAAARAQAMFDCWMEEQEENIQPKDIAECRADFDAAMAELNAALKPMMAAAPPPPPPPGTYTIYFQFDNAGLTGKAPDTVKRIAKEVASNGIAKVVLVGHADRAGDQSYNNRLAADRVAAVAKALSAAGVAATMISTDSKGEDDPAVNTPDGERQIGNRRVTVVLSR